MSDTYVTQIIELVEYGNPTQYLLISQILLLVEYSKPYPIELAQQVIAQTIP